MNSKMEHVLKVDAHLPDIRDDFTDRFLEGLPPPRRRHYTEIAAMHTTPRRLENIAREKVRRRQQIATRKLIFVDLNIIAHRGYALELFTALVLLKL